MKTIKAPSVFGWAADQSGCGYYRIGLPFGYLQSKFGLRCVASTMMIEKARDEADIIVGQRVCLQGASDTWQQLAKDGRRLSFEVDDDLWHIHPTNEKPYHFFDKDTLGRLTNNVRVASMVTVTNENLANILREFNDNVQVIPNYIDGNLLNHERPRRENLTIGWSGSFTHAMDFRVAEIQLERFFKKNPEIDMHFIGHSYADRIKKPNSIKSGWNEEVFEYQKSIDFDIGVIPLKYDIFNESKSYIKALEYAALGIPVVASNTGPYRDFVQHGVTGFLVDSKRTLDWEKYLNILVNQPEVREEMGAAARKHAANYTIQEHVMEWLQVYAGLMPVVEEQNA